MADHLLHLDSIEAEGYVRWRLSCEHPPSDGDGPWCYRNPDGTPYDNSGECWFESWWSALGQELLGPIDGPITLPLPVKPSDDWAYDDGGTIIAAPPEAAT